MQATQKMPSLECIGTTECVHINTAEIPLEIGESLAASAMDLIRDILRQPGGREKLEARATALQKRKG